MTIIDKIKAEFQKRFEKCQSVSEDDRNALDIQDYYRGKYTAYSEAISFINMLLQEQENKQDQPVPTIMTNEMLMGEIKPKKKSNAIFDKCVENCDPAVMKEVSDHVDKMLLEEAAMNYIAPIENEDGLKVINFSGRDMMDAFKAGAEWQRFADWLEKQKEQKSAESSDALEIDTIRDWSMRFAPDIREEIVATAYHFYNLRSK